MVNEKKELLSSSSSSGANYELIEVEDIVPVGANSFFLCVARTLIYLAYKYPSLVEALKSRIGVDCEMLKSDMALQFHIRVKLCQHFLKTGVFFSHDEGAFKLKQS